MRKTYLRSSILGVLLTLFACGAPKGGELKDVTKPYLGFYECESATLSGKDVIPEFDYIRIELKKDQTFTLSYAKKGKKKVEERGKYEYDKEKERIRLITNVGLKREFPLKDGYIEIYIQFIGKQLNMRFKQQ